MAMKCAKANINFKLLCMILSLWFNLIKRKFITRIKQHSGKLEQPHNLIQHRVDIYIRPPIKLIGVPARGFAPSTCPPHLISDNEIRQARVQWEI